jgi:hypothetical protein
MTTFYSDLCKAIAAKGDPVCDCERCFDYRKAPDFDVYKCDGCKREIPYCLGSDGFFPDGSSNFEFCNDCRIVIQDFQEATISSQPQNQLTDFERNQIFED